MNPANREPVNGRSSINSRSKRFRIPFLSKHMSIQTRLVLGSMVSGCIAIVIASTCFLWHDMRMLRESKVTRLKNLAATIGLCQEIFESPDDAEKVLGSWFGVRPTIDQACFFDDRNRPVASWSRKSEAMIPAWRPENTQFLSDGKLQIFYPVSRGTKQAGTLYLLDNNSDVHAQFLYYCQIAILVTLIAGAISALLAMQLQSFITRPIRQLAAASEKVRRDNDYNVRVDEDAGGELATLCSSFNQMLAEIGQSKTDLHESRDELEKRITDRTAQLRMEIAERKKIEADLMRALDAARDVNDARCLFLASMSHEIRTPLNAILGFSELLLQEVDSDAEERRTFVETILTSGRHLLELINGILDFSKMDAGQMDMEQRTFSPDHLIAEVISVLSVKAREKNLELSHEWVTGVPATITNDESRLRQSIFNLVGNALKFTESGRVHVRIALLVDRSPAVLRMEVIDTGIGIPGDKLQDIFEPFVQADASVTRKYGGTGLGLAITRKIAQAMGGDLVATSEMGRGSTFTMTVSTGNLDGVAIHSEPTATVEARDTISEIHAAKLTGARLLVVEDTDANRKLIRIILERAGAQLDLGINGKEGRDLALANDYDLVLMDMQMPIMDGYEATRQLRAAGYEKPIFALTSNALQGDAVKCREAGCSGYITKPIDTNFLIRTILENIGPLDDRVIESKCEECDSVVNRNDQSPREEKPTIETGPAAEPVAADVSPTISEQTPSAVSPTTASIETTASVTPPIKDIPVPNSRPDAIRTQLPVEDDDELGEVVVEFVERLHQQIRELVVAAENNDRHTVHGLAHIIRGSGGTAGFPCFTDPATKLMARAETASLEEILAMIEDLRIIAERVEAPQVEKAG